MSGEMEFYLVAVPAVIILGLSKGGFTGLSSLAMPMLSLVISPVRAAAIVLPVLIVQDWVSVWAFRRDFSPRNLVILIPSAMIGVAAGWLLAARVSEDAVRLAVGIISIAFVLYMLARDRLGRAPVETPGLPGGLLWGVARRLHQLHQPRRGAAVPGLCHAPEPEAAGLRGDCDDVLRCGQPDQGRRPYFLLGQFSRDNLTVSAGLIPVAILSTFAGVWIVRRVSTDRFYAIILIITFVIGAKLIYDAVQALVA